MNSSSGHASRDAGHRQDAVSDSPVEREKEPKKEEPEKQIAKKPKATIWLGSGLFYSLLSGERRHDSLADVVLNINRFRG